MTLTLDSNVLVYALDTREPEKRRIASDILLRSMTLDVVLTAQAIGEFLVVVRRKNPSIFPMAFAEAERWATIFPIAPTTWEHIAEAAALAERHRIQFWDCVIWQVARANGASILVSEDFQDGLSLEGMTVLDPFAPGNAAALESLLTETA